MDVKKTVTLSKEAWQELRNWQTDNGGTFSECIIYLVRNKRSDLE